MVYIDGLAFPGYLGALYGMTTTHDPLRDKDTCGLCATAMRLTFVEMKDIPGAPMNTVEFVEFMREIADRKVQLLRRNPDYNFMWDVG